jgi:hypothetical protein
MLGNPPWESLKMIVLLLVGLVGCEGAKGAVTPFGSSKGLDSVAGVCLRAYRVTVD